MIFDLILFAVFVFAIITVIKNELEHGNKMDRLYDNRARVMNHIRNKRR